MRPLLPGQRLTFANRQKREFEHILNFLSSEEATNFKAKRIALSSALTDGYCREASCCLKTAVNTALSYIQW